MLALDPGRLPPVFAYALDQYVMRGGKVVFLVDPYSEVRHALQGYPPRPDAEMGEYLKTWGIDYHAERVAGDVLRGERVKGGDGRYRVYPLWFWAKGEDGRPLRFHTPGSLLAAENFADLHFSELAATGGQSGDIAAEKIRYASKTQVILDYNQDNKNGCWRCWRRESSVPITAAAFSTRRNLPSPICRLPFVTPRWRSLPTAILPRMSCGSLPVIRKSGVRHRALCRQCGVFARAD